MLKEIRVLRVGAMEPMGRVPGRVRMESPAPVCFGEDEAMGVSDWRRAYEEKKKDPKEALRSVEPGSRVFVGSGCSEPQALVRLLPELWLEWMDVEILQAFSLGRIGYSDPKFRDSVRLKSFFLGPDARQAVSMGRADYTPVHMRRLPDLFRSGRIPIHTALIQVSPPDKEGTCSYGINVDVVASAVQAARRVIAQVNPRMPRTRGDTRIHIDEIDMVVEHEEPLPEYRLPPPSAVHVRIGRRVAELVEDRSTVAAGLGLSSVQALRALADKKDLGIHTDVFHEGFLDLIESGAVTHRAKTAFPGKAVAACCIGTKRLYDYVHDNPQIELHPTEMVNDPMVIGTHDRMVSISPALEVDLTGQVSAESLGYRIFAGLGGYVDFVLGAGLSKGGKHIVTLPSCYRDGSRSRIVSHLPEGSGVTVTRGFVQYVVTEFGAVNLQGLSLRERALALIDIAHPRFRKPLLLAAKRLHYVYEDQEIPDPAHSLYPEQWETEETFKGGVRIRFRPIKPTDERAVQELFYSLPKEDIRSRFLSPIKAFPHQNTQAMCTIDYVHEMAIVGTLGEAGAEKVVAMARYIREPDSDMAEVDFTVRREYQGMGIGTFLIRYLAEIARQNGIRGFKAYVLAVNRKMLTVFCRIGARLRTKMDEGVLELSLHFDDPADHCPFEVRDS